MIFWMPLVPLRWRKVPTQETYRTGAHDGRRSQREGSPALVRCAAAKNLWPCRSGGFRARRMGCVTWKQGLVNHEWVIFSVFLGLDDIRDRFLVTLTHVQSFFWDQIHLPYMSTQQSSFSDVKATKYHGRSNHYEQSLGDMPWETAS